MIVHVVVDRAFKRFFENASQAEMPLFRGMFLTVTLDGPLQDGEAKPGIKHLGFQQTFLPKFENEKQDESIADAIVAAADKHYMVATIKHSGSLNTLSHNLMGAKNSIDNEFTAVAIMLLHAHYHRLFECASVSHRHRVWS